MSFVIITQKTFFDKYIKYDNVLIVIKSACNQTHKFLTNRKCHW